jgi:hypothetical protein
MRLTATDSRRERQWRELLAAEAPGVASDPFLPELAERLSSLAEAGFDTTHLRIRVHINTMRSESEHHCIDRERR